MEGSEVALSITNAINLIPPLITTAADAPTDTRATLGKGPEVVRIRIERIEFVAHDRS